MSYGRSIALQLAQRFMSQHAQSFAQASERLSSGLRINRASDDAAGLAISSRLRSDARVYSQALRNGNDAISALSIAEGSVTQLSDVVTRLKELATQASNGSFSRTQRNSLNEEAESLVLEFNRIVSTTEFNKLELFSPDLSRMRIQLGYGLDGSIDFGLGSELRRNIGTGLSSSNTVFVSGTSSQSQQALGDVNGDGILDLVTGNAGSMPNFNLSLGNGDGTFQAFTAIASSGSTNKVTLADVNGDGRLDLLGSSTGATMDVYLNQGGSTPFSSYTTYTTSGSANRAIEVADINGDGWVDVVTGGNSSANVSVLMGTGGGSFGASTAYTFSATLKDMRLRDFNGDGVVDIGVVSNSGLHLMAGSPSGVFGSEQLTAVALTGARMDAADIDHDGIYDIVATNSSTAVVYRGRADGTFELSATLDPSAGSAAITETKFVDADGDGIIDVYTGASDNLTFFKGRGDGTFEEQSNSLVSGSAGTLSFGDLNGDGVLDVVANYSINGRVLIKLATTEESGSIQRFNLSTRETALEALEALDEISARITGELGVIGSTQSRVLAGLGALRAMTDRSDEARARIEDVDVAVEAAQAVRSRILQDAAATVLSHASTSSQFLLDLLKF